MDETGYGLRVLNLELNQVAREADERLRQALASLDPTHSR